MFSVKQGVGQGRVLSAWMFLVYINDLLVTLSSSNVGISIFDRRIPGILLCDDTTLIGHSGRDLVIMLNILDEYAIKWKMSYNATKSVIVIFRLQKNLTLPMIEFKISGRVIPIKENVTYGGVGFAYNLNPKEAIQAACSKTKQILHSLSSFGVRCGNLDPSVCCKIWNRMILPCSLYGCEFYFNPSKSDILLLERVQRYFARYILGFCQRTSSVTLGYSLCLMPLETYIEKQKLNLFGRLCNSNDTGILKFIFWRRLAMAVINQKLNKIQLGLLPDCLKALKKYNLTAMLQNYLHVLDFPEPAIWRYHIRDAVASREKLQFLNISMNDHPVRFFAVHKVFGYNICLLICRVFPHLTMQFYFLLLLSQVKMREDTCKHCQNPRMCSDLVLHIILNCQNHRLIQMRTELLEAFVEPLSTREAAKFHDQTDDIILENLLGGIIFSSEINASMAARVNALLIAAKHIIGFKPFFPVPLY